MHTDDLLDPPPMGRALIAAGGATAIGAAAWAALSIYAGREHGLVAWGIGGLIGFAIVKAGGHGKLLAASGAILAVLAIGTGKHFSYQATVSSLVEMQDPAGLDPEATEEDIRSRFSFTDYLKEDFKGPDLLFLGLGIGSALGIVLRRTSELHREARQKLRDERQSGNGSTAASSTDAEQGSDA